MEQKMSSSSPLTLDPFPSSEQLCYLHCTICDTILAVSVPCSSLFKTVTVRCGHCTNLLPVNMCSLLMPSANQLHFAHSFFSPRSLLEEIPSPNPNFMMNPNNDFFQPAITQGGIDEHSRPPVTHRPAAEKRQRVPSAYNRFIKDEIQRIKAANPDISHREAFSAAAKNWAHFPHIHFGLMSDQTASKRASMRHQLDKDDVLMKEGFFASASFGHVSPY